MSEYELELNLQEQANISRIKNIFEKVEEEIRTENSVNDINELNFNDVL